MSRGIRRTSRAVGAASVVLLVLGILFAVGGGFALVAGLACAAALSSSGFGGICTSEEAGGAFTLLLGIAFLAVAIATWNRKKGRKGR